MKKLRRYEQPVMFISKGDDLSGWVFGVGLFLLFLILGIYAGFILSSFTNNPTH